MSIIYLFLAEHNTYFSQNITTVDKDQFSDISSDPSKISIRSADHDVFSDQTLSGYSASGSAREESNTDSDFDGRKESFLSEEYLYPVGSDDDNLKHTKELIDQKVRSVTY